MKVRGQIDSIQMTLFPDFAYENFRPHVIPSPPPPISLHWEALDFQTESHIRVH